MKRTPGKPTPEQLDRLVECMRDNCFDCNHSQTLTLPWPDGGCVQFCEGCKMSRYLWEQGQSPWLDKGDLDNIRRLAEEEGMFLYGQ